MPSFRTKRLPVSLAAVAALTLLFAASVRADDDDNESQVRRGFQIVPQGVHLNLAGKNRALVGLGSTSSTPAAATTATPIRSTCRTATRSWGSPR